LTALLINHFMNSNAQPKIGIVSLGCPKALVDSERIITKLRSDGYALSADYAGADIVVVNTCGFLDSARDESLEAIGEAMNENGKVLVTGCLGAEPDVIREKFPNVLGITGPHQYEAVVGAVHEHAPIEKNKFVDLVPEAGLKLTPRHYAYLKISEGCNNKCSFCIIPSMRGLLASRPLGDVMREADNLVKSGVKELLVISQDTSAYGQDLKYASSIWRDKEYRTKFYDLCDAMGELDAWVRMHYVYPYPHVDDVIPLMAEGKILPYLDIPFQHASPAVLKNMKRPGKIDKTADRIHKWRDICPDITLRSTFIVGFPGETEDDFNMLMDWLDEVQLDRVGCFKYEDVRGATSSSLNNHVPEEIKEERWHAFMTKQQGISATKMQAKVGSMQDCIIDGVGEDGKTLIARSKADAPEIDGNVFITECTKPVTSGDIVQVKITSADEYDLFGSV
jgi:ribosomal protein S12 methylthiotransferase